jgi:hypothetical protein
MPEPAQQLRDVSPRSELRDWRNGQTNAERTCAAILAINGYTDVDPPTPLGGPDDKEDILAVAQAIRRHAPAEAVSASVDCLRYSAAPRAQKPNCAQLS